MVQVSDMGSAQGGTERALKDLARNESYWGGRLSAGQFEQSWLLAGIVEDQIRRTGKFSEKMADYAHAFARSEKFDVTLADDIIRGQFKNRTGVTMNDFRKAIMEREKTVELDPGYQSQALNAATQIAKTIETRKIPYWRALDQAAVPLSKEHGVTESHVKSMMKEQMASKGEDLYAIGKEAEDRFYKPHMEKLKAEREASKEPERSNPGISRS